MRFLRAHTSIPVPDVLAVDEDKDGLVGGPFMLMNCVRDFWNDPDRRK